MSHCCPKKLIKFFKSVCDEQRQEILSLLREKGELNVSDIVKKMKLSQPTVSHHLKILCDAEVISVNKKGKERFYSLSEKHVNSCCMNFMDWFSKKK